MKIILFGPTGALGSEIVRNPPPAAEIIPANAVRLSSSALIEQFVGAYKPDLVINCAALTDVGACQNFTYSALETNAHAPAAIALACIKYGAALIHVSTNFVFPGPPPDGRKGWVEGDPPDAVNVYGFVKYIGEAAIASYFRASLTNLPWWVLRTAYLFGSRAGKMDIFQFLASSFIEKGRVDYYHRDEDRIQPTYIPELARIIREIAEKTPPRGIYHAAGASTCSFHDMMHAVRSHLATKYGLENLTTKLLHAGQVKFVEHPLSAILDCSKLKAAGIEPPGPWIDFAPRYIRELVEASSLPSRSDTDPTPS